MNEAFDVYRDLCVLHLSICSPFVREISELIVSGGSSHRYYEGGVSSVYLWDTEDGGFAGVVLIKKSESPVSEASRIYDEELTKMRHSSSHGLELVYSFLGFRFVLLVPCSVPCTEV
jgi:hypothetical protein